jgi:hypothetical protein
LEIPVPKHQRNHLHLQLLRRAACREQRGLCFHCCQPMVKPTAEHLIARRDGGADTRGNVVAACLSCNHSRHADPYYSGLSADEFGWLRSFERASASASHGQPCAEVCI